jgi:hypothetical protein
MATPLRACPTPHKHAYRSEGEALAGFHVASYTRFHRPYRCCCGRWHITSHPRPHEDGLGRYSQPSPGIEPGAPRGAA